MVSLLQQLKKPAVTPPAFLLSFLLSLSLLAGCASPRNEAVTLAAQGGLTAQEVTAAPFVLMAMVPARWQAGAPLTVYIEGDGHAWIDRYRQSDDPTPHNPVGLKLALRDHGPNVMYLARPCQYVQGASRVNCAPAYWSTARFHANVVTATSSAIDRFKAAAGASAVRLRGFSGGGTLALLVAASRKDVTEVVTVSAALDTEAWARLNGITPLYDSLNPADYATALAGIPQLHLLGGDDAGMPPGVAQAYLSRFPAADKRPQIKTIAGQTHDCCWEPLWPQAGRLP